MFKKTALADELYLNMDNILSGKQAKEEQIKLEKQALKEDILYVMDYFDDLPSGKKIFDHILNKVENV